MTEGEGEGAVGGRGGNEGRGGGETCASVLGEGPRLEALGTGVQMPISSMEKGIQSGIQVQGTRRVGRRTRSRRGKGGDKKEKRKDNKNKAEEKGLKTHVDMEEAHKSRGKSNPWLLYHLGSKEAGTIPLLP